VQVDLSGLRALVTGSTKGIGFAIAQKLAASGAAVAVNGRKAGDVEAALGRIRAAVTNATLIAAPGDVAQCAKKAEGPVIGLGLQHL
jgi:NAD(P)-dependent dehydrogenase (short-subunit alcohol dehydrogenase family)